MSTTIPPNNNTGLYNTQGSTVPTVDGNIAADNIVATGNVTVGGYVSAVGNISGNYILGNGSQLTGLPETYANANVASYLASGSDTLNIITQANISGAYILGNGSQLSGLPATYSNANVASYLPVYNGNIGANVVTANLFSGSGANLTNLTGANVTGTVANATYATNAGSATTATSAVTAVTVTGNAQPAINSVGTLSSLSVTGNIDGGNLNTGGNVTAAFLKTSGVQGNITGANYVSANYFVGDGSLLTNLPAGDYSNANVADYLPTYSGNVGYGNLVLASAGSANSVIHRNTQSGTTGVEIATTTANPDIFSKVSVGSDRITLQQDNNGNANVVLIGGYGVEIQSQSTPSSPVYTWDFLSNGNTFTPGNIQIPNTAGIYYANGTQYGGSTYGDSNVNTHLAAFGSNTVSTTGNITAGYFAGNGSLLTNLTGANISGTVAQAAQANYANIANSVSGSNVSGTVADASHATVADSANAVAGANVVGTVASATQSTYADTANAVAGGNVSGQVANALVAGTVYTNAQPNITSVGVLSSLSASGNITGNYIFGNGSQLTGLPATYSDANVAAYLPTYTGNLAGGNLTIGNNAQINNDLSVTGTIYGTFAGNISGNLVVPGSNTQVIYNNNGNAGASANFTFDSAASTLTVNGNVATGSISAVGNVAANNISGNTVTAATVSATGSLDGATASVAGNITGGNILTGGVVSAVGNVRGANFNTTGLVSVTGNVIAGNVSGTNIVATYLYGDGSNITGVVAGSQSTRVEVKNTSGVTLPVGTPVYATGTVGATTVLEVSASRADTESTMPCAGLLTTTLNNNDVGYAISVGTLTAVDTSVYTVGTDLYVGPTGGLTSNRPTGSNLVQSVGTVGRVNASTGSIDTNIWNYLQLPNLANGQIWQGNATGYPTQVTPYGNSNVVTLMGSFDGNPISTTGNISAGYFAGNGSLLTNITGANVTGTVANATYATSAGSASTATDAAHATVADSANAVAGGNVTGQVANALVAGTVYTAAQPAITSVGTLSSLSVAGNIAAGGILTDGYYYANGAPFSGGGGSTYGDSNVVTLLSAFGSNTISTTGNVSVSNLNMSGQIYDSSGVLQLNGSGNIVLVPVGSTVAQGNVNIIGGQLTADAVTYANADGTAGQVLTTYGNGQTYFSTVSGGGSPGGSDSQIQYNNGGAFGGNVAMTFDDVTGNITLGNIVTNTNTIQTVAVANIPATTTFGATTPWRIMLGNGYNGSANSIYAQANPGSIASALNAPRLLVADNVTMTNTGGRFQESTTAAWVTLAANISNTSTRINSTRAELMIGGGANAYVITATSPLVATASTHQMTLGRGTNANLSAVGNLTTSGGIAGVFSGVTVGASSGANYATGVYTQLTPTDNGTAYGNINYGVGYQALVTTSLSNTSVSPMTSYASYYQPGPTSSINIFGSNGSVMGSVPRNATNYHAFRNDDTLAKSRLGSLETFNEWTSNVTSSGGSLTIDKANGQVQQIYPTENVTSISFSNFVTGVSKPNSTIVNQTDTVTLIIVQGATPYTFTMPSGTAYKYAGGANTVGATANTTTMISITGTYNYSTLANQYLITISPEFS